MILITSIGEFLLYFTVIFLFYFHLIYIKKKILAGLFLVLSCVALFLLQDCIFSGLEL